MPRPSASPGWRPSRALLGTRVGATRKLRTPAGMAEIEVVAIAYPAR
jgi:transcription elongation GreA/GreB family factor